VIAESFIQPIKEAIGRRYKRQTSSWRKVQLDGMEDDQKRPATRLNIQHPESSLAAQILETLPCVPVVVCRIVVRDVVLGSRQAHVSAGSEDPEAFLEKREWVRDVLKHLHQQDGVHTLISERQRLTIPN
jgi:hypothetical protein